MNNLVPQGLKVTQQDKRAKRCNWQYGQQTTAGYACMKRNVLKSFMKLLIFELLEPWWCHQKGIIFPLLAIYAGNSPVTGEFPAQRPVTRGFHVLFICVGTNSWANNRDASDLRRPRAHYDVIVMCRCHCCMVPAFWCDGKQKYGKLIPCSLYSNDRD